MPIIYEILLQAAIRRSIPRGNRGIIVAACQLETTFFLFFLWCEDNIH
eukprot:COSAG01_NODE_258_length_20077_cov_124.162429_27_plen_48_part_00